MRIISRLSKSVPVDVYPLVGLITFACGYAVYQGLVSFSDNSVRYTPHDRSDPHYFLSQNPDFDKSKVMVSHKDRQERS